MKDSDSNWIETVAFCKDPAFQVAATGSLNGEIFIWDISKQVCCILHLKIKTFLVLCKKPIMSLKNV